MKETKVFAKQKPANAKHLPSIIYEDLKSAMNNGKKGYEILKRTVFNLCSV